MQIRKNYILSYQKKKNAQLEQLEKDKKRNFDEVCKKMVEYELANGVYGAGSDKSEQIEKEFVELRNQYESKDYQEIELLGLEIKWLREQLDKLELFK